MNILIFVSHAEVMRKMSMSRVVLVRKLEISRTLGTLKFWRIILKCKTQGKFVPVLKYSITAQFYTLDLLTRPSLWSSGQSSWLQKPEDPCSIPGATKFSE
jgi:hypothetical protein